MSEYQSAHNFDPADVFLYILAFFFPPLPVVLRCGFWTNQFLMNILLTMLFGLPGTFHAIYIVYITSPITGSPERRVRLAGHGDYESLVENNEPTIPASASASAAYNAPGQGSHSTQHDAPPPYEDNTGVSTDNKVQSVV